MGLFTRGAIKSMILDGQPASQAYLGSVLVWDGTTPAFVSAPIAIIGAWMPTPIVRGHATVTATPAAASTLTRPPTLRATATPTAQRAFAAASFGNLTITADTRIDVETATASARSINPLSDNTIDTPPASATAAISPPAIRTPGSVIALPVTAAADTKTPTVTAATSLQPSTATGSATAANPAIRRGTTATAVRATATATAPTPTVTAINISNMGMDKSGTQSLPGGGATTQVTGWTVRPGYPTTAIVGNRLTSDGAGAKTLSAQLTLTSGVNYGNVVVSLMQNTTVLGSVTLTAGVKVATVNAIPVTLAQGDSIGLQVKTSAYSGETVGATGTYIYWD